jgi:endonuclease YncB( thermonuclease family)
VTGGVAPGWYPDYDAPPGHQRFWDGARWTERRSSTPVVHPAPPAPNRRPWLLAAVAVLVVLSAGAIVLGNRETGPSGATTPPAATTPGPPPSEQQDLPIEEPANTWAVDAVVDGTTIELGNGVRVRIAGITNECAEEVLEKLVGERVTLTRKGPDKDADGSLLRYVDRDGVDVGKRLIQRGVATASDESNPRRAIYRRIDERSPSTCTS